ncbi:MAG: imidazoleglycerol-phosphate dehydratase HisB [Spirochaetes bacterium]|jgi:imidazoleglycerol-phosphate dehydratase|nr:imidazoleglycerol-phosphate dehydratase HisB [Spirochaetota bacterium]
MERKASIKRQTSETKITVELVLDSIKDPVIESGVPFFDHMLATMCKYGRFWMNLKCAGDNDIDDHHSIEDIGISMGRAFREALGDKSGIVRFGNSIIPMEDSLALVAVDLSGRPFFKYSGPELNGTIGKYSEELTGEFLRSFSMNSGMNLHVKVFYGENRHHMHETVFKALGMSLFKAVSLDGSLEGSPLSTKGKIE